MRIGVLRTQVPFVTGGAERHAANLVAALQRHGHVAAEITVPFKWYPGEVLADHILAAKLLDVSEVEGVAVDRMIGLKFPAYLAHHPDMQFWIIHQHRQAYDQWALGNSDLLDDPDGAALRALIRAEDARAFEASRHPVYANSGNVAARLKDHLGVVSTPLYHPPPQADAMLQGGYGDYLFAPGRINPSKRLDLILRALARTKSKMRLVIAGTAENPAYADTLRALALELGVSGQVEWLGAVDDATLLRSYAEARAVVFVPSDEDYGYITLEAMLAGKPVITVTDAGGPLEFITDGAEGLITAPEPGPLARAFDQIMQDAAQAEKMGQAGHARYTGMNISWDHVVERLVGASTPQPGPLAAAGAGQGRATDTPEAAEPPQDPQAHAMALLAAAVAPPMPPKALPFASIMDVLEHFVFDALPAELGQPEPPVDAGLASYLGTHWTRYVTTLEALKGLNPRDTLDVGVFPPLVFQAMLSQLYPDITMSGLWEGPQPCAQTVRLRATGEEAFSVMLKAANTERDPWPYPDNSFDLVTGMEILEHLALDPYFFFSEANRVLRPGGHLLMTTPNITSHRGVWKMMNGIAPYSHGVFVPSGGVYGRHNREYAPRELATIGQAAGFETTSLRTMDVYSRDMDPGTAEMLVARDDDLSMRGETIFYLGTKAQPPQGTPQELYHGDPARMAGAFHVGPREVETGLISVGLENRSPLWWHVKGHGATCLLAEWIDPDGVLIHQLVIQPIAAPVGPGDTHRISLRLDPGPEQTGQGLLRLHFYQIGSSVFSGTGRAAPVFLPCSRAAFHSLARTMPQPDQDG